VVILKDHASRLKLGHNRLVTPIAVIIEMRKASGHMLSINANLLITLSKRGFKRALM